MNKKYGNFIVIGGPVAVGKSTLVKSLGFPFITELIEDSIIQDRILEGTYHDDRVSDELVQIFFAKRREGIWRENANKDVLHIFDRSILETKPFASEKMAPDVYQAFEKYIDAVVKDLLEKEGYPKLYIVLTCSWDVFKERIFARNRPVEILNFEQNHSFWEDHIKNYEKIMREILTKYNIDYHFVNTDTLIKEDVVKQVKDLLLSKQIIK